MEKTVNQRRYAILSGTSLFVMAAAAMFAMGLVFAPIFEMSREVFVEQFYSMKTSLLFGVAAWLLILLCDLLVSWTLYKFYADKNKFKSMLMGVFRLFYSLILLYAIIQLIRVVLPSIAAMEAYNFIQRFQAIWQFGLIVFGIHLLYLAGMVCEKKTIKKVLALLLFVAGIGYIISNTADLFIADYETIRSRVEAIFILPMIFGELGLAGWLLAKGGKTEI